MSQWYIIYRGTIFLRKLRGGYSLVESYNGEVDLRHDLPEASTIKSLVKKNKIKGKKDRFCIVNISGNVEALPGWGVPLGNMMPDDEEEQKSLVELLLGQEDIEALVYVDGEDIQYVDSETA